MKDQTDANFGKFADPAVTADGQRRASVALSGLRTLWVNTGTLCNIACAHCYIESSPVNDALVYISAEEVSEAIVDVQARGHPLEEVGFTGGEPFLNPAFPAMVEDTLRRGLKVLILTNAMKPMMRPRCRAALERVQAAYPGRLTMRISIDHHGRGLHDAERGAGAFEETLTGMRWLRDAGIAMAVAGRGFSEEGEAEMRAGYAALFAREGFAIDAQDPAQCVLFPEMDLRAEVPEITTACWGILNKRPADVMCASSRMLVKRKGEAPSYAACTLLPHDPRFDMGSGAPERGQSVALNHPHCAKFCVLGGASCAA
ncbi:radical SAM domain protein [Pseudooceanicola batsensis HTCC2597]|uniref:Radical SAM domain protein n=1 Tax=Pseudooceanicola batsensis (strain ATCC BAA-863 / DSM 15984 / KCTC 12145 / HTCC2597) TaxID=252305 RepID=A3TXI1_PSEBH|nr:radical SAM protein [Pseudooceanicola batsensis]EAQ03541.1 radical SAM domain protein [Pseudooceanicola batsensis HTCC2597]